MLRALDDARPVVNAKPFRTRDFSVELQLSRPAARAAVYRHLHVVTVVLSGTPEIIRESGAVRLVPGESSVAPAGRGERVVWPRGLHAVHIHLHPRFVRTLGETVLGRPGLALASRPRQRDRALEALARALVELAAGREHHETRAAAALVETLARHLLRSGAAESPAPAVVGRRRLEELLDVIREGRTGGVTVAGLARWCGLSRSYFSRVVHQRAGISPLGLLLGSRIEAAKHLLEQGDMALSRVACEAGFADQSHLTRSLVRATGYTPAGYRRARPARG